VELGAAGQHEGIGRMSKVSMIARLKITLEDVEPQVMRRIDVPLKIKLDRLHLVVQAAMPWTNSHLWGIEAGGANWGDASMGFDDALPAAKTTLLVITHPLEIYDQAPIVFRIA
jgi:hypothetical protein